MSTVAVDIKSPSASRYSWIDVAKGIGMILVVVDHCIFFDHSIIRLFHIPLFFLIAGMLFKVKDNVSFLISKVDRIGIPYAFWMIVSAIFALIPHPYSGNFNGPLWFLQTMFVTMIIAQIVLRQSIKIQIVICALLAVVFYALGVWQIIPDTLPFSLTRGFIAFIYFAIGYHLKQIILSNHIHKIKLLVALALSIVVFSVILAYVVYKDGPLEHFVTLGLYSHDCILVFLGSLAGILATLIISKIIASNRFLEYIGLNSLTIMCVHFPFAQTLNVYFSSLPFYSSIQGKVILGLIEYVVVIAIACLLVNICNRYIPRLTGNKPLISKA